MEILEVENDLLTTPCNAIGIVDKDVRDLARAMKQTLIESGSGIGLAAPQVGYLVRIVVVELLDDALKRKLMRSHLVLVNPEITGQSAELTTAEEGCLSIPGIHLPVTRPDAVKIKYLDLQGRRQLLMASGMTARVLQHEMDHLDGKLITDKA